MVLVRAVIRREKLGDVIRALVSAGFTGATVINNAGGIGGEGGVMEVKGRSYEILIPRVVVEVATTADKAKMVVEIISASAKTGHVGDGRIFILPLLDSVRVRTGESGVI
ncbi:MAG: P-II family nitrogen regulator [Thermoproteus sp.]|nr:P-II family nitrogen regulator [Thermoproteus sp.]